MAVRMIGSQQFTDGAGGSWLKPADGAIDDHRPIGRDIPQQNPLVSRKRFGKAQEIVFLHQEGFHKPRPNQFGGGTVVLLLAVSVIKTAQSGEEQLSAGIRIIPEQ